MLPITSSNDSAVPEGTRGSVKVGPKDRTVGRPPNPVGELDAGNLHVQFDERGVETGHGALLGHWQPKGPANTQGAT
jgi:hypothetical protein